MSKTAVVMAALCAVALAAAPAAAQLPLPAPVPGVGTQATPLVSYLWYEPSRSEVESGRGLEVAVMFSLAGPVKGRLQYAWPQSGGYSNLGLAAVLGVGGKLYVGTGYARTKGHETTPVSRSITENQPYAFVGMISRGMLYSLVFEAERSFGDELKGTTLKAGVSTAW